MTGPLHPLLSHPMKWFPKFNPHDGMPAKEHINNFMFSINLNAVIEEDVVVRLFPYTLQGPSELWYFSLSSRFINSLYAFQEKFLTNFGDDRSTNTLLNDLSNLKVEPREPIKEFNSHFNKLLNKIPMESKPSDKVQNEWSILLFPQTKLFLSIALPNLI